MSNQDEDKDLDFIDLLMTKAFNLPAPKAPTFKSSQNESATIVEFSSFNKNNTKTSQIEECSDEDLDFLCAAGKNPDLPDDEK